MFTVLTHKAFLHFDLTLHEIQLPTCNYFIAEDGSNGAETFEKFVM